MNILQVSPSYKPAFIYGGPVISVADLCEKLLEEGCSLTVFTTTANGSSELPDHEKKAVLVNQVPVFYFKRQTGDHTHFSFSLFRSLWRRAKDHDIIHIHSWWNLVSLISCSIALIRKRKVVISPRGMLSNYSFGNRNGWSKAIIHHLLGKHLLKRCSIHVTSLGEKDELLKLVAPGRITLIPNLIKLPPIHFEFKAPDAGAKFKLLYFSRIDQKKGLDILLNALAESTVPFTLSIAGSGREEYINELKELARSLGLSENIKWLGIIGQEQKFECIQSHHLLVLPSHNENFANVVIESLSVGTPVLISKGVGLSVYIEESGLGWVCDAEANSLRNCLEVLYADTEKQQIIRQTAPGRVRCDFNENHLVKIYHDFYHNLCYAPV